MFQSTALQAPQEKKNYLLIQTCSSFYLCRLQIFKIPQHCTLLYNSTTTKRDKCQKGRRYVSPLKVTVCPCLGQRPPSKGILALYTIAERCTSCTLNHCRIHGDFGIVSQCYRMQETSHPHTICRWRFAALPAAIAYLAALQHLCIVLGKEPHI